MRNKKQLIYATPVAKLLGKSKMTLYRWIDAGKFIKPFKVGSQNAWLLSDVEAWIDQQMGGQR